MQQKELADWIMQDLAANHGPVGDVTRKLVDSITNGIEKYISSLQYCSYCDDRLPRLCFDCATEKAKGT